MFVGAGIIAIAVGVFCIWDADLAWKLYEMDNRTWGHSTEQPANWRSLVYYMGYFLMVIGMLIVVIGVENLVH